MTILNKGDIEVASGSNNQFGILSAGANNSVLVFDSTQPNGVRTDTVNNLLTIVAQEEVYVSLQGSDSTGNGSAINPWATIAHAQASISPTTTSRYVIWLSPGFYSENVHLNANVFIAATAPVETRLTGNLDINHASWNTSGIDNRSGLINLEHRTGTTTFDFTAQAGNDNGKLYIYRCRFSDQPAITGLSTGQANQIIFDGCYFFSGVANNGAIVQIVNSYNSGGSYQNTSSASASRVSDMEILGGCNDGNYSNTWTSNSACTMEIEGVGFGSSTTITNTASTPANATLTINRGSMPDNTKITNTGVINVIGGLSTGINRSWVSRATPAFNTSYTPSTTNDAEVSVIFTYTNTAGQISTVSITVNSVVILKKQKTDVVSGDIDSFNFTVPVGQSYQVVNSGSGAQNLNTIYELIK